MTLSTLKPEEPILLYSLFDGLPGSVIPRHIMHENPVKAFKRFFAAVRSGRGDAAYLALIPSARNVGSVKPLDLIKIPLSDEPRQITDPSSFKKYWKSVFHGAKGQTRGVQILKAMKIHDLPNNTAIIEAKIQFSSYTTALALLFGPLIVSLFTRKETLTIRKLLIRRDNKWFFASGELSGALDQISAS